MKLLHLSLPLYRSKISLFERSVSRGEKKTKSSTPSRLFRQLFEHKRIKALFGGTLALLVLSSSLFSPIVSAVSSTEKVEAINTPTEAFELTTRVGTRLPINGSHLTQSYSSKHPGIDLAGTFGTPIYPVRKGRVESVVFDRFGFGNHIVIDHGSGFKSLYAHLSKIEVSIGEEVEITKEIGKVGATGRAFGNHLHFEIYENGRPVNPVTVLPLK